MALKEDIETEVANIFKQQWTEKDGNVVPDTADLKLGNDATKLTATVLYADLAESTALVDSKSKTFAAEVYKTYLTCAARIIRSEGGAITAYDGDRIMGVFIGDMKNTEAVRTGMKLNKAVHDIINPALSKQYDTTYRVAHRVGIDTSELYVARVGVRNNNDLVWVGRAANYAAKLCAIHENNTVFITDEVFIIMKDSVKYSGTPQQSMWTERKWSQMNDKRIYSSKWRWGSV